ncbi:MAG: hypothetical protein N3G22_04925 [Candidatus Micrarchaeota archaeon]|nr:hypothetical protein [Candidatus Micrarchaeota archaeon]
MGMDLAKRLAILGTSAAIVGFNACNDVKPLPEPRRSLQFGAAELADNMDRIGDRTCEVLVNGKRYRIEIESKETTRSFMGQFWDMYVLAYENLSDTTYPKVVLGPVWVEKDRDEKVLSYLDKERPLNISIRNNYGGKKNVTYLLDSATIEKIIEILDSANVKVFEKMKKKVVGSNLPEKSIKDDAVEKQKYLIATKEIRNNPALAIVKRNTRPLKTVPRA